MAILSVNNLSKDFIDVPVFKNVSFHVENKDKIGLIGQNGSGKSTLLNILNGELGYDSGEIYYQKNSNPKYMKQHTKISSDKNIFDECLTVFEDVFTLEEKIRELELKMSKITEDSDESQKLLDEYGRLTEIYQNTDGASIKSRVTGVLKGLGFLESDFKKEVNTLSGGQKSRINLAKLLLQNPDFMFLDEPTNHLDIKSVTWLEDYLKNYNGTFIVVSHDRFFLDKVVNKIFLLENLKLTSYSGNYSDFQVKRAEEIKILQNQYENQQAEIEREKKIIERFLSVGREKSIRQGQSRLKKLEKIELLDPVKINKNANIRFKTDIKAGNDIFIAENLKKSFGDKKIFENISFRCFNGDRIGIIGENGIGKSTLFNILSGEDLNYDGNLSIGSNVFISYFDQEMSHLDPDKTIIEEVWDSYPKLTHYEIRSYLAKMMFVGDAVLKEIKNLSGGEKSRISILKIMLSNANVLLMDEPTNHLDIDSKEILENALKSYDGTVIAISHDRYFLNHFADKIWEMTSNEMIEYLGDYDYYYEKKFGDEKDTDYSDDMTQTQKIAIKKKKREEERLKNQKKAELKDLEKKITEIESEISAIDAEMANPEIAKDYEKILELDKMRNEKKNLLDELYENWLEYE